MKLAESSRLHLSCIRDYWGYCLVPVKMFSHKRWRSIPKSLSQPEGIPFDCLRRFALEPCWLRKMMRKRQTLASSFEKSCIGCLQSSPQVNEDPAGLPIRGLSYTSCLHRSPWQPRVDEGVHVLVRRLSRLITRTQRVQQTGC